MKKNKYDISAIITAHHEGIMAGISLKSLLDAKEYAERAGLSIECVIILDKPDTATNNVFSDCIGEGWVRLETDFGDQGLARNQGVLSSQGKYIAFLDADDLWGYNWLLAAWEMCETDPGKIIAHPEFNWFFQNVNNIYIKTDQTDSFFKPEFMRVGNYWDALCLAPREAYLGHPFAKRDIDNRFAYEDWQWGCETLEEGYIHRIVDDTIHYKRRRSNSQTIEASSSGAIMRLTKLSDYAWDVK